MSADRNRLDPQERALAERLAALPRRGPSPELDAKVLAAARAAVARPSRRPHWRWGMGAAAAAVLTLGVFAPLWRVEQTQAPPAAEWFQPDAGETESTAADERATAAESSTTGAADATDRPAAGAKQQQQQEHDTTLFDSAEPAEDTSYRERSEVDLAAPQVLSKPQVKSEAAAPPRPFPADSMPSPMPASPPPASVPVPMPAPVLMPPPPQPAAEPAPVEPAPMPALQRDAAEAQERQRQADGPRPAEAKRRAEVSEARTQTEDLDRYPSEARDWLQRIRDLLARGDDTAARTELARFVDRFPDLPLPADLAALRDRTE